MAGKKEGKILRRLEKIFAKEFAVATRPNETRLPLRQKRTDGPCYEPDMVLRRTGSQVISHIIEVETDPVRKNLVGAAVLCDYFVSQLRQRRKPQLLFVIGKEGLRSINRFRDRIAIARRYVTNIRVFAGTEDQVRRRVMGR